MCVRVFAVFVAVAFFCSGEVFAQGPVGPPAEVQAETPPVRSHTQGLFLKVHLAGTSLSIDSETDSGGGFGVKAGYGLSRLVTLFAGFDGSSMESGAYNYGLFDIGARFNFRAAEQALVPFVEVALTGQAASMDVFGSTLVLSGRGITLGGGLQYFVSPTVALDAGLYGTGGSFTRASYQGDSGSIDERTAGGRFTLGVSFYPIR